MAGNPVDIFPIKNYASYLVFVDFLPIVSYVLQNLLILLLSNNCIKFIVYLMLPGLNNCS